MATEGMGLHFERARDFSRPLSPPEKPYDARILGKIVKNQSTITKKAFEDAQKFPPSAFVRRVKNHIILLYNFPNQRNTVFFKTFQKEMCEIILKILKNETILTQEDILKASPDNINTKDKITFQDALDIVGATLTKLEETFDLEQYILEHALLNNITMRGVQSE